MSTLTVHRCEHPTATVLAVAGDVDLATVPDLRTALDALPDRHLVLDPGGVGFLGAAGLHPVIATRDRLRAAHRDLVVVGSEHVRRVLGLPGLHLLLTAVSTRAAACALLSVPDQAVPDPRVPDPRVPDPRVPAGRGTGDG